MVITGQGELGQHLVHHAVARDGGKCRGSLGAQHNQVGLLRLALVQQFLGRVARPHDRLDGNLVAQFLRHQVHQVRLNLVQSVAGQDLVGPGDESHAADQAGIVFMRQVRARPPPGPLAS